MEHTRIKWLAEPEGHDYDAAASFLTLIHKDDAVKDRVNELKAAVVTRLKAKDIFRASGLSLLGISNSHVVKDLLKIHDGKKLSPILLVRDPGLGKVIIADGYHRLCAVYTLDEDAEIPCKIA